MLHDVAQDVYRRGRAGIRHVNVIDRAVEARVGVHVTARFLHLLVNAAAGARGGALEEHVFEHMRKAGAEPFALVNAAGHGPRLRGDDRRAVIFAHDDDQAVFERGEGDPGGRAGMSPLELGLLIADECRTGRVFGNATGANQFGAGRITGRARLRKINFQA